MISPRDPLPAHIGPPEPAPDLRRRTLAAARKALGRAEQPDLWTRLFSSSAVRLAWAASVAALLFGHVVVSGDLATTPTGPALPVRAAAIASEELAEVAAVGRLTVALPGFEVSAATLRRAVPRIEEGEDRS
jgi:hypothetical protein